MPSPFRQRLDAAAPPPQDPITYCPPWTVRAVPGEDDAPAYLVSLASTDDSGSRQLMVTPYTWGWVGLQIAEGVLGGAGASVWDSVVGGGKPDLAKLLAQLLERIAAIVQQAIAEDAKRRAEAELASLQTLFGMYRNNKDAALLQPLLIKASDITFETLSLGLPTIGSFAIVGGLGLAVLQEIFLRSQAEGDRKNIADFAILLWGKQFEFMKLLGDFNNGRFLGVLCVPLGDCNYFVEGKRYAYPDKPTAKKAMAAHQFEEYQRLEAEILGPFYPIAAKWREIAIDNGWEPPDVQPL